MSRRIKPHKVCGRQLEEVREKDPEGRIVYHHRTVDSLGKMLRAGTIDQAMHERPRTSRRRSSSRTWTRCARFRSSGFRG
jgi:hypothetical protein